MIFSSTVNVTGKCVGKLEGVVAYMLLAGDPNLIYTVPQYPLQEDPNIDIFREWKIKRLNYNRFQILDLTGEQ